MWDSEHFPGADHVPWPFLIRARFTHELDAILASSITRALAEVLPVKAAAAFGRAATRAVAAAPREEAGAETKMTFLVAYADFDDWCGTKWPRPPFPRPHGFEEFLDPFAIITIDRARELLAAGSPELQKGLGSVLDELGGSLGG